jgi:hypothetical protein
VEESVGGEDQAEGYEGDDDFAYGSYEEGADALLAEVSEVGAETYSGEG